MNSKQIEDIAIYAVKGFFLHSSTVDTYLNDNDKGPAWDGHFYLYNVGDGKKKHLLGRIAVQVKGKTKNDFKVSNFKYPIQMTDLKAYLHEGTIYLVVQEVGNKTKIFYRTLTPVVLKNIIRAHKNQQTVNVLMDPFPETCEEMELELRQFLIDCKKQISFADKDPFTFKEMNEEGINTFSITQVRGKDMHPTLIELTKHPVYVYASLFKQIEVPIDGGPFLLNLSTTSSLPVSVNGTEYYDHCRCVFRDGFANLEIGNCLDLTIKEVDDTQVNISYNFSTKKIKFLNDAVKDAKFILNLADTEKIKIGNKEFELPDSFNSSFVQYWKQCLKNWQELQSTLNILHVHEDLDLSMLKEDDNSTLNLLVHMILYNEELPLNIKQSIIYDLKLANLHLLLILVHLTNGKFRMLDFFDSTFGLECSSEFPEGRLKDSAYSYLINQPQLLCSNIYYEGVIPSYKSIKGDNPHVYERANAFGLYLLGASDNMPNDDIKKGDYLTCAKSLFDWLIDDDGLNKDIYCLNKIQTVKRLGQIDDNDRKWLQQVIADDSEQGMTKFGAAIILESYSDAKAFFKAMTREEQKLVVHQPIWKFTNEKLVVEEGN